MTEPTSSDEAALIVTTVRLSQRLSVTFTISQTHFVCEWIPEQPAHLTKKELRLYRQARDAVVAELAEKLGLNSGKILVVET